MGEKIIVSNKKSLNFQEEIFDSEDHLSKLIVLEQQFELIEKRFNSLYDYIKYIRNLYLGSEFDASSNGESGLPDSLSYFPTNQFGPSMSVLLPNERVVDSGLFVEAARDCSEVESLYINLSTIKDIGVRKKKFAKRKGVVKKTFKNLSIDKATKPLEKFKTKVKTQKSLIALKNSEADNAFESNLLKSSVSQQKRKLSLNSIVKDIPAVTGKITSSQNLCMKIQDHLPRSNRKTPAETSQCFYNDIKC